MLLVLVGMPGSGKSTLGRELALKLNFAFKDLDDLICEREGASISEIFHEKGETYFRLAEKNALESLFSRQQLVLATGGGAPCFFDNMEQINRSGISLFLDTPLEIIVKRILADSKNVRPLYSHKSPEELLRTLEEIYQKRIVFYQKALFKF